MQINSIIRDLSGVATQYIFDLPTVEYNIIHRLALIDVDYAWVEFLRWVTTTQYSVFAVGNNMSIANWEQVFTDFDLDAQTTMVVSSIRGLFLTGVDPVTDSVPTFTYTYSVGVI
jgi:hypothetical protein